jgi:drug/metabolite transporter (DMT)-like permease
VKQDTRARLKPSKIWASLAILLAVTLWGLSFVSMKIVINSGLPPYTMITLRYFIVVMILAFIFVSKSQYKRVKPSRKDRNLFLWSGAIGITAYFLFEAKGISLTTASSASIIIAMVPVFSFLADKIFFHQRSNFIQILGIILSIIGVYAIFSVSLEPFHTASHPLMGNILMLGACFCWVGYSVLSKALHQRFSSFYITTMQGFYGFLFLIPFALLELPAWVPVSGMAWLHLFFLAVLCSVLAYYLYNIALKALGITVVSVYVNLIPVVGVLGSVLILREPVYPAQWLGGSLIVISLFMVHHTSNDVTTLHEHP